MQFDEYLGDQEEGFCFKGICTLEQYWRKCIDTLRNNGTTSALGHFHSTGAENYLIIPCRVVRDNVLPCLT